MNLSLPAGFLPGAFFGAPRKGRTEHTLLAQQRKLLLSGHKNRISRQASYSFQRDSNEKFSLFRIEQNVLIGGIATVAGVAGSVGALIWIEQMGARGSTRPNAQNCVACKGTGKLTCGNCSGGGRIVIPLAEGRSMKETCFNCEGGGSIVCTNCQGSGIQPRYLDRREFVDDD